MNNWMNKYMNRPEFLEVFATEQDYVDAMFSIIVMYNFGVYLDASMMHVQESVNSKRGGSHPRMQQG